MKNVILSILFTCSSVYTIAGDGWVQAKNSGYFKINQWWLISDQHFTNTGDLDPNQTRATHITSIYGEYGISDKFTAILYFPFFTRSLSFDQKSSTTGEIIQEGEAINSVGDTELTIKYGLVQNDNIVLSTSYTLGLPFGVTDGGSDGSLQTGIGEFYQMLRLDISKSFTIGNSFPFASVYGAFNYRTKNFSNELRYGFKAGVELKNWLFIINTFGVYSFKNVENNFGNSGTSIFGNNAEYFSISPEIAYQFSDKIGITANIAMPIWGKLILAAPSYSVGVFLVP